MIRTKRLFAMTGAIAAGVIFSAQGAIAHPEAGTTVTNGFLHGFLHPWLGLDHLLAMVAVGLWASQLNGKATWAVPLSFVSAMLMAAGLAQSGWALPWVEPAIIGSDIVLGLMILWSVKLSMPIGMGLAGLLAIFHGYAHGSEMPANVSLFDYGAGFVLATMSLHAIGALIGWMLSNTSKSRQRTAFQLAGASILGGTLYTIVM